DAVRVDRHVQRVAAVDDLVGRVERVRVNGALGAGRNAADHACPVRAGFGQVVDDRGCDVRGADGEGYLRDVRRGERVLGRRDQLDRAGVLLLRGAAACGNQDRDEDEEQ